MAPLPLCSLHRSVARYIAQQAKLRTRSFSMHAHSRRLYYHDSRAIVGRQNERGWWVVGDSGGMMCMNSDDVE